MSVLLKDLGKPGAEQIYQQPECGGSSNENKRANLVVKPNLCRLSIAHREEQTPHKFTAVTELNSVFGFEEVSKMNLGNPIDDTSVTPCEYKSLAATTIPCYRQL
ncbi:hypothetical protein CBL_11059 [Carabus blaptoides fortunei]